jgi:integrase
VPKRGNSEGTVVRRADGRWEARLTFPGGKRKSLYGKTRLEVARRLAAAIRERDDGLPVLNDRQTVGQFLEAWLEKNVKSSVRPSTYDAYRHYTMAYLIPMLGRTALTRLTPQQVQSMLNELLRNGLSPLTVRHVRTILTTALNKALKWALVSRNVAALTDPPEYGGYEILPMKPEDARALFDAVRDDRLGALYVVTLSCGLRRGEVLGLQWPDVDLDHRTLTVSRQLQRIDHIPRLVPTKTTRSRRALVLPTVALEALREHRARQAEEQLRAGSGWHGSDFVFTTDRGWPLDGPTVTHRLQKILQRAGLPPRRLHDLRHGCATLLFAQGILRRTAQDVMLKTVSETLGHAQIGITADLYTHMFPQLRHEVARMMDEVFDSSTERAEEPSLDKGSEARSIGQRRSHAG